MAVVYGDNRRVVFLALVAGALMFAIGVIIGYYGHAGTAAGSGEQAAAVENKFTDELVDSFLDQADRNQIRDFKRVLAAEPHIAASDRDRWLTSWMEEKWKEFGLQDVSRSTYDFLLSYPDQTNPNKIYLYDQNNQEVWRSRHQETVSGEDSHPNFIHAFNAYSPKGDVSGELVYVNYGSVEDLQLLEELGVDIKGKIAIARYGKVFRGSKRENCERAGAIGVILYSDPQEVALEGLEPENVYPNTFFLPDTGMQRGTVNNGDGDPLTPGWTSIKGAYRLTVNETESLPGIPTQPIGYGDATELLRRMGGAEVPVEWRGLIPNITYKLGPGFNQDHQGWKVRLVVNNYLEDKEDSVLTGVLRGEVEPDRFVLIGNHRDAWGFGAGDPSSGTASLMEMVRVFGGMYKAGWRPRRTIVFASWCVEEYGLQGSYEFVYENIHAISNRAVAVINLDTCVAGDIIDPWVSPLLKDVFIQALQKVKNPDDSTDRSMYDFLEQYIKKGDKPLNKFKDYVRTLGSGSDHAGFSFYAGIPSFYFKFNPDKQKYKGLTHHPTYHTGFETLNLLEKIVDPNYSKHRACTQLCSHLSLNLLESPILPFNLEDIADEVQKGLDSLENTGNTKILRENGAGAAYDGMVTKFKIFKAECSKVSNTIKAINLSQISESRLRELNDRLLLLERVFIIPTGLPGRHEERHILFSPAKFNKWGSSALPGITDLLHGVETLNATQTVQRFKEIRRHISDIMIVFHQATRWLSDSRVF